MANATWPGAQRSNLAQWSERPENAAWNNVNCTLAVNDTFDPLTGLNQTVDKVTLVAGNVPHYLIPPGTDVVVTGQYTHSVYVKPGTMTRLFFELGNGSSGVVQFDLVGAGQASYVSRLSVITAGVQQLANGWYRCWSTTSFNASTAKMVAYFGGYGNYNAAGTETMWIWGAMMEQSGVLGNYISNPGGSTVTVTDYTVPGTLPNWASGSDPVYTPYDNTIRSQPDVGQAKVRRRFTGKNETCTLTLEMSATQLATFWSFFDSTVQEVLPFDWVDFRTGKTQTYRFKKRPKTKWLAGDGTAGTAYWAVDIELETVYTVGGAASVVTVTPYEYLLVGAVSTGQITGTTGSDGNAVFTLPQTPNLGYPVIAYRNGVRLIRGNDFTVNSNQITFIAPNIPIPNDSVVINYYA